MARRCGIRTRNGNIDFLLPLEAIIKKTLIFIFLADRRDRDPIVDEFRINPLLTTNLVQLSQRLSQQTSINNPSPVGNLPIHSSYTLYTICCEYFNPNLGLEKQKFGIHKIYPRSRACVISRSSVHQRL